MHKSHKIINLGILAHVDAGKTTLTEAILHISGALRHAGRVDDGNTVTDSMAVERERGITVRAATVSFYHKGAKVNILDTPGHMDFISEVERSLRVLDAAVMVVSAREGIQTQTRRLWAALKQAGVPTLIFINKIDRAGADADGVLRDMRAELGANAFDLASDCADTVIEADDALTDMYLSGEEISDAALQSGLRRAVAERKLFPALRGAALREQGVLALMDAIVDILPGAVSNADGLACEVYKVERLQKLGRVCYARVWSGELRRGDSVLLRGEWRRIKQLMTLEKGKLENADAVPCGDIAALCGADEALIGDIITNGDTGVTARRVRIAEPLLYSNVECASEKRGEVISALRELADEDPLLGVEISEITNELLLRIFGTVQMEIITALMSERFALDISLGEPRTIFREKPAGYGEGKVAWEDTHYYAAIDMAIEPCEGEGIEYETRVDFGYLTKSFQTAVKDGALDALKHGYYGWQVFGAKVILTDAHFSSVDSSPADFRNIAPIAIHRALKACGSRLFEPYVRYSLRVPDEHASRAAYDISTLGGSIERTYSEGDIFVCEGVAPLDALKGYPRRLLSYSKGIGAIDMRHEDYRERAGKREILPREGYDPTNIEKYLLQKAGRI